MKLIITILLVFVCSLSYSQDVDSVYVSRFGVYSDSAIEVGSDTLKNTFLGVDTSTATIKVIYGYVIWKNYRYVYEKIGRSIGYSFSLYVDEKYRPISKTICIIKNL